MRIVLVVGAAVGCWVCEREGQGERGERVCVREREREMKRGERGDRERGRQGDRESGRQGDRVERERERGERGREGQKERLRRRSTHPASRRHTFFDIGPPYDPRYSPPVGS